MRSTQKRKLIIYWQKYQKLFLWLKLFVTQFSSIFRIGKKLTFTFGQLSIVFFELKDEIIKVRGLITLNACIKYRNYYKYWFGFYVTTFFKLMKKLHKALHFIKN